MFTANAAWLVLAVMAFTLTRAAATIAGNGLARATTATIRRKLVTVPARISSSARRITFHLPEHWLWKKPWTALFNQNIRSRQPAPTRPTSRHRHQQEHERNTRAARPGPHPGLKRRNPAKPKSGSVQRLTGGFRPIKGLQFEISHIVAPTMPIGMDVSSVSPR